MTGVDGTLLGERIDIFLDAEAMAVGALRAYFASGDYTGQWFETLGGGGRLQPYRITSDDLVALALLGVSVRHRAAKELLVVPDNGIEECLRDVGSPGIALWDCDAERLIGQSGPGERLWNRIREVPGFGDTRTNKLLARKRPELFPVWDKVIQKALNPPKHDFWRPLRDALVEDGMHRVERLRTLRGLAGIDDVSLLRVLDVVIWMRNHGARQVCRHARWFDPALC